MVSLSTLASSILLVCILSMIIMGGILRYVKLKKPETTKLKRAVETVFGGVLLVTIAVFFFNGLLALGLRDTVFITEEKITIEGKEVSYVPLKSYI